jgi:hypothetical protein
MAIVLNRTWHAMLGVSLVATAWRVVRLQMVDGLQIWKVAANIFSSSCRQPTRGGLPAWGLSVGLTTPHCKEKYVCYEML